MKTLAVRYWLIIALAIYFITSIIPFMYIGSVVCATSKPTPESLTLGSTLSQNVSRWSDPAWQADLRALVPTTSSVILIGADGRELFRYGKPPRDPTPAGYTQYVIMDGTHTAGIANIYDVSPCGGQIYETLAVPASVAVQVLVGLGIAWVLSISMLRPLSAMSAAAQRIAAGDLEFDLPPSRVREVAEVTSAFRAMGDALRGSIVRQAELEQERRFFVSAIAHDLRTPLFALRGYLEGLSQGVAATPEKVDHYIRMAQDKADALERLIADLFAYSRLEFLEQVPQKQPLDFAELARQVAGDFAPRADAKGARLALDGPAAVPVRGDPSLLGRALANLLDNALRYTPPGGEIRLRWALDGALVRFSVADTGPGIDSHDLPNVFKPLYRADQARQQGEGAGLGLTVAQRVLRAHGGDLTAGSAPGGGAELSGSFPAG